MPLTDEQQREASWRVAAWRSDPARPVRCPACGAEGLNIVDRSARPHAEWYALICPACGLSETLHIPLGAAVPRLD
jgi:transcription elongation factor Elf1